MMRGIFITFEGPEGSGKSTHVRRLAAKLRAMGRKVVTVREPGGTPVGEAIRDVLQHDRRGEKMSPETEALLFMASRAHLVREIIRPALERGACVISDRFGDSTIAYQGFGRGLDVKALINLNAFVVDGAVPDLTLVLDLDVRHGFARLRARNKKKKESPDRIEREKLPFHRRVRRGYLALARKNPKRFKVIDANREISAVDDSIWKAVCRKLGRMR